MTDQDPHHLIQRNGYTSPRALMRDLFRVVRALEPSMEEEESALDAAYVGDWETVQRVVRAVVSRGPVDTNGLLGRCADDALAGLGIKRRRRADTSAIARWADAPDRPTCWAVQILLLRATRQSRHAGMMVLQASAWEREEGAKALLRIVAEVYEEWKAAGGVTPKGRSAPRLPPAAHEVQVGEVGEDHDDAAQRGEDREPVLPHLPLRDDRDPDHEEYPRVEQ